MTRQAILIDYEYCTGCKTCEMACQKEHGYAIGVSGIVVNEIGPWQIEGEKWQYDFIPVLTDACDLCADRVEKGHIPTCVKHCMASVITFGPADDVMAAAPDKAKQLLFLK